MTPNFADLGFDQLKTLILKSRETRGKERGMGGEE